MRFSTSTNPFYASGSFAREACGCRFKGGVTGDKSTSNSSTSNTTSTDNRQTDNRIATSGETSIVAAGGSSIGSVVLESQDAETTRLAIEGAGVAIKSNQAVSTKALESAVDLGKYSFDSARDLGKAALDTSRQQQKDTLAFTDAAIAKASDAFANAKSGDTAQLQTTIKQIAVAGLVGGTVLGVGYLATRKH